MASGIMRRIFLISFVLNVTVAMLIPEHTEMLDGYAPISMPEISPEDDYYEARSLSESMLYNSIRNKRNANYEVLESNGLRSHFRPNNVNAFKTIFGERVNQDEQLLHRNVRSTETDAIEKHGKIVDETKKEQNKTNEELPTALRRVMKTGGFFPDTKSASASALVSKWTRTPFEYSKIQHEEDSMAMDSSQSSHTVNEGIKARTPRVNFVTQQKKSLDQNDDSKSSATKPEFYKSPPLIHDSKDTSQSSYGGGGGGSGSGSGGDRSSERNPPRPSSYPEYYRERDPDKYYMNHYDNRYIDDGMHGMPAPPSQPPLPPYAYESLAEYRRFYDTYDPYMPRMPSYPEQYYDYPDSRYDVPDYRDYPPMNGNDVDDRYYTPSDMAPPPPISRRRIIYYAHLPEIVRNSPLADQRYRSYDRYDPYYDYYNYNPTMNSYRSPMPNHPYMRPESDYPAASSARPINANETMRSGKTDKRFDASEKFIADKSSSRAQSYRNEYTRSSYY